MTIEAKTWPRLTIVQNSVLLTRQKEALHIGENKSGATFLGTETALLAANVHPSVESSGLVSVSGINTVGAGTTFHGTAKIADSRIAGNCEIGDNAVLIRSSIGDRTHIGAQAYLKVAYLQDCSSVGIATRLEAFNSYGLEEPSAPLIGPYLRLDEVNTFVSEVVVVDQRPTYYLIAGQYLRVGCTTKKIPDWISAELLNLLQHYRILAVANWESLLDYYVNHTRKSERSEEIRTMREMAELLFSHREFKFQQQELDSVKFRLPAE